MGLTFCQRWWVRKQKPLNIINAEEAQSCHDQNKSYSVVVENHNRVTHVLDITGNTVIVRFFNELDQMYLIYEFIRIQEHRIFLKGAIHYEYDGNTKTEELIFNFNESGYVFMQKWNRLTNESIQKELHVNVTANWDEYPAFGDYTRLLIVERDATNSLL